MVSRHKITVAAAIVASAAATNLAGPARASDSPGVTLRYHCVFSLLDTQPVVVVVEYGTPAAVEVGQPVASQPFSVRATFSRTLLSGLGFVGVAGFDGSADVASDIRGPQGDIRKKVTLDVPKTGVPSSGSLTVAASGNTPVVTFDQAGTAEVRAGSVTFHLHRYYANGFPAAPLSLDCTLDGGQSDVMATFAIAAAASASSTPSSSTAQTPPSQAVVSSHPTTPSSVSASATAHAQGSDTAPGSSIAALGPLSASDTATTGSAVPADTGPAASTAPAAAELHTDAADGPLVDRGAAVTDWLLVACALVAAGGAGVFGAARLNKRRNQGT